MKIDKGKLIIQILALIGIVLTVKLAVIYYVANYEKYALASFCSINEFIDCDGAARTTFSQVFGIPLAYWGFFFYITILFLTFVDTLKNIRILGFLKVFKNPVAYITVLGTAAFTLSMVLAGISLFVIKKLCILCVITYIIDLLIALTAISHKTYLTSDFAEESNDAELKAEKQGFIKSFIITFKDFIDGIKTYPKTFIILLIFSISFLTYSGVTNIFVPHIKKSAEIRKYFNMKKNPYRVKGNVLGNENGDVTIELYSDYVCPLCYVNNIMLHKAVKEYGNVVVIHHNMPFDKECNKSITYDMHPGACFMARAAMAAGKQGNYWEMNSLLYENKPMNEQELDKLVEQLNFDKDKFYRDLNSEDIRLELSEELKHANELKLNSTPTMYVNGEMHVGLMQYKDLKEFLEKHGARKHK